MHHGKTLDSIASSSYSLMRIHAKYIDWVYALKTLVQDKQEGSTAMRRSELVHVGAGFLMERIHRIH